MQLRESLVKTEDPDDALVETLLVLGTQTLQDALSVDIIETAR